MPIKLDKPIKVRMMKTIELQPYHLKALWHWYGCKTRPQIKAWLEGGGYFRLEDLPKKTDEEWEIWRNA